MVKTTIDKDKFEELLLPFKYNGVLIYSKQLEGITGLYGYIDDSLFFKPLAELGDKFEIESPESVDELHEFMGSMDYIMQRLSMNADIVIRGHVSEPTDMKKAIEPFVRFSKTFERNIHTLEGIKNAC